MKLYTAPKLPFEKKIEIIEGYLNKRGSLREIAHSIGISYLTLWRWVRRYKQGGKENLKRQNSYKRSKRRMPRKLEKWIMRLKEHNPALTTTEALKISKKRVFISHIKEYGRFGGDMD